MTSDSVRTPSIALGAAACMRAWQAFRFLLGVICVPGLFSGCSESESVSVNLYARNVSARDPRTLEIQAQISGSLEGIHYKWFATDGQCNPQQSTIPVTRFRFAVDSKEDQITVDVWRHDKRIARGQLNVKISAPVSPPVTSNLRIEISSIPLAAKGGPDTRAEIAGRVLGDIPPDSRIVLYARDEGVWFIQPTTNAKHKLTDEGMWSSWTHSGSAYAAILVTPDFVPMRTLDTIPALRADILARIVVDGRLQ